MRVLRVLATTFLGVFVSSPLAAQATGSVKGRVLERGRRNPLWCLSRHSLSARSVGRTDRQQRHLCRPLGTGGQVARACDPHRLRTRYDPRRRSGDVVR
jgi:hypothetical protein